MVPEVEEAVISRSRPRDGWSESTSTRRVTANDPRRRPGDPQVAGAAPLPGPAPGAHRAASLVGRAPLRPPDPSRQGGDGAAPRPGELSRWASIASIPGTSTSSPPSSSRSPSATWSASSTGCARAGSPSPPAGTCTAGPPAGSRRTRRAPPARRGPGQAATEVVYNSFPQSRPFLYPGRAILGSSLQDTGDWAIPLIVR